MASFYTGALAGFSIGLLGARFLFRRDWEDSVAIGFIGLFSNSVLLGLPITERAYGADALGPNFAIVALHSPFCYGIGITAMEIARGRGAGIIQTTSRVFGAMFRNSMMIGIALGFAVNLSGVALPAAASDALALMVRAALPSALFGLGAIMYHYRPEGDLRVIAFICAVSLVIHPAITWGMGRWMGLESAPFRSAVLTAAMAPGVNAYVFANMYGRAKRVAASAVLFSTCACVVTGWAWLTLLG
jgi:malonate transporter